MPHLATSRHADHDRLLVAAYAAGDAAGTELDAAQAQVAACPECAALHHDLRSIAAALPALPPPARSRDFRLTPGQAAALRPPAWRRLLEPFAGPRFAFAGPLGTGLATLGIAGLLLAGSLGSPLAAPMTANAPTASGDGTGAGGAEQAAPAGSPGDLLPGTRQQASPGAQMAPAVPGEISAYASEVPGLTTTGEPAKGPLDAGPIAPLPADESVASEGSGAGPWPAVAALSGVALLGGVLLFGLRLAGRRLGVRT